MKARHLGPCAVGDEERIVADVERRRAAEVAAPLAHAAHMLEIFVQQVRDHAQRVG
jgi:hypothetical protein